MKKFFYKVLSLVLCVTMLFTMSCVSFAHSEIKDEYNYVTEENVIHEDETQVKKLFNRFYTVENARTSTGLGLSIARTLA